MAGVLGSVGAAEAQSCSGPVRLHLLPTATVPCPKTFRLEFGQTSTLTSGAAGGAGGSGNQTYIIRADHGIADGLAVSYIFDYNDDPTWDEINGERPQKKIFLLGAGLRGQLYGGARTRVAVEATAARLGLKSDPGLYTNRPDFEWEAFLVGSLGVAVDRDLGRGWTGTLTTSVALLPGANNGVPLFGRSHLVGGGLYGRVHPRLQLFATGDLVLGPGHNHIDGDGVFRRVPLGSFGLIYAVSPQVRITAYGTNQAGGNEPTRHLTLLGSVPMEAGVRLQWEPTVRLPEGVDAEWLHGTATVTADQRNGQSVRATAVVARNLSVEAGFSWTPGLRVQDRFGLRLGGEAQYRLGGTVRLVRRDEGAGADLDARVTIGRSYETQQGYLIAELRVARGLGRGIEVAATPTMAQNGADTPAGVELRAAKALGAGPSFYVSPLVLLTPHPTAWTAGVQTPWIRGAFMLDAYASTAQSPMGIGRFVSVGDEPRVGVALHARW